MALRLLDDNAIGGPLRPGLEALAARLSDVIPEVPVTSPILVSGDWGSGKTSLLTTVRKRLEAPFLDEKDRATVWFDAWHHEGEGALLPALMRRVWEEAPSRYRGTEKAVGLLAKVTRFAMALGMRALPVAARLLGWGAAADAITKLGTNAVKDEMGAVRELGFDSSEPGVDPVESLRAAFAELVHEAWGGRVATVFIDDLDRCSPDGAVALLDAVRMLISGATAAPCRFVVALDRAIVVEAISAKFEKIRGYDGNRYLEKLFPLEFHVPQPSPAESDQLVKELLFGESDERNRLALNRVLAHPVFANPRLMKRCINRFRLVRHFEITVQEAMGVAAAGGTSEEQSDRDLAEWIAATERWPILRTLMRQYDTHDWETVTLQLKQEQANVAPEIAQLRSQPGLRLWYTKSKFVTGPIRDYQSADQRLRLAGL